MSHPLDRAGRGLRGPLPCWPPSKELKYGGGEAEGHFKWLYDKLNIGEVQFKRQKRRRNAFEWTELGPIELSNSITRRRSLENTIRLHKNFLEAYSKSAGPDKTNEGIHKQRTFKKKKKKARTHADPGFYFCENSCVCDVRTPSGGSASDRS